MSDYYTLLTITGQQKKTAADAGGPPVVIAEMAFGDGGGAPVVPVENRAALVHEVHRQPLTSLDVHEVNLNWLVAKTIIAMAVGGWTIREVGLYDADGDLIAYGNFPDTYKPILAEGSAKELIVETIMEVASTANITLQVDPSFVYATEAWVLAKSYATQAWVTAQGYATQAWVTAKNYATQAWVAAQGYITAAANLGAGAGQIFSAKVGSELRLRSIKAGENVTVTQTADEITIGAPTVLPDHGALPGLGDDDHPQYLTQARGDARYALIGEDAASSTSAKLRIPCAGGVDWVVQKGDAIMPASNSSKNTLYVEFPTPFKAGEVPHVDLTPHGTYALGPAVAYLAAAPTNVGFTAYIDIAEGDGSGSGTFNFATPFLWKAEGQADPL